jgi:hypothetical protein
LIEIPIKIATTLKISNVQFFLNERCNERNHSQKRKPLSRFTFTLHPKTFIDCCNVFRKEQPKFIFTSMFLSKVTEAVLLRQTIAREVIASPTFTENKTRMDNSRWRLWLRFDCTSFALRARETERRSSVGDSAGRALQSGGAVKGRVGGESSANGASGVSG